MSTQLKQSQEREETNREATKELERNNTIYDLRETVTCEISATLLTTFHPVSTKKHFPTKLCIWHCYCISRGKLHMTFLSVECFLRLCSCTVVVVVRLLGTCFAGDEGIRHSLAHDRTDHASQLVPRPTATSNSYINQSNTSIGPDLAFNAVVSATISIASTISSRRLNRLLALSVVHCFIETRFLGLLPTVIGKVKM